MKDNLPNWLLLCISKSLLGEIYRELRAVAAELSDDNRLTLRYYLDREPTDDDYDSIETVETEISAMTSRSEVSSSKLECIYTELPLSQVDPLGGFVYARKEEERKGGSPVE